MTRPTQITTILQTISSGGDIQNIGELETYMADLEQPDRPAHIAIIMQAIGARYSVEIVIALNIYLCDLETRNRQQNPSSKDEALFDPENPPVWSHQRTVMRERQRRERALRKLNDYR